MKVRISTRKRQTIVEYSTKPGETIFERVQAFLEEREKLTGIWFDHGFGTQTDPKVYMAITEEGREIKVFAEKILD